MLYINWHCYFLEPICLIKLPARVSSGCSSTRILMLHGHTDLMDLIFTKNSPVVTARMRACMLCCWVWWQAGGWLLPRLLPREERGYRSLTFDRRLERVSGMMAPPNERAWKGQRSLQEVAIIRQHDFLFLKNNLRKNACSVAPAWKLQHVCV